MWTENECWTIISDDLNWQILNHEAKTAWSTPELNSITGTTTAPTKGSGDTDKNLWRRDGQIAEINMRLSFVSGGSDGSGDYI